MIEGDQLVVIDLARRTAIGAVSGASTNALAFVDDAHVAALDDARQLLWFEEVGLVPSFAAMKPQRIDGLLDLAAGGGRLVATAGSALAIATPQRTDYLGYAVPAASAIGAGGSGALLVAAGSAATLLDADLRGHGAFDFASPVSLTWLGGDDWLAAIEKGLAIASTRAGAPIEIVRDDSPVPFGRYEPSTRLATTSFSDGAAAYRWDGAKRTLTPVATAPHGPAFFATQLAPTAPDRAGGTEIVRVAMRDHATVEWFSDARMTARTAAIEVGAVLAIDRSARVYAWTLGAPARVGIFERGAEVGRLPLTSSAAVVPEPTGERVAVLSATRLEVYDGDRRLWSRDVTTGWSVEWLTDGALALATATAIERLDPATGEVRVRRCGWRFGLSSSPLPAAPIGEPACARE
jgi:hypothetical protein